MKSTVTVLLVSKNLKGLSIARSYLAARGYSVMTASTMQEAMKLHQKCSPSFLFISTECCSDMSHDLLEVFQIIKH